MLRTAQLYLKTTEGVRGPFATRRLREMANLGDITDSTPVSPDGRRWTEACRIRGLFPPRTAEERQRPAASESRKSYVPVAVTRPELRRLLQAVDRTIRWVPPLFNLAVSGTVLVVLFGVFWGATRLGVALDARMTFLLLAFTALLPSMLVAAAAGHAVGNLVLRLVTALNDAERRCLALHLPWSRAPRSWPRYLKNWVYDGDWLVERADYASLPYVRAFITGAPPRDIGNELDLWVDLMTGVAARAGKRWEVGHSVRELAVVESLPPWASRIEDGTGLAELEERLGAAAHEWAGSLLRRACSRLPAFRDIDLEGDLRDVTFEFHYASLREREREALLVIIRPRPDAVGSREEPSGEMAA